jgi:tRNA/tmRNA/rRNA uracil-C5-methylase (TrmA/RlmC/RlmD family)
VTLSRDLKPLLAAGLRVQSVQGFDMFPRTHHFETLVWLEPRSSG